METRVLKPQDSNTQEQPSSSTDEKRQEGWVLSLRSEKNEWDTSLIVKMQDINGCI